MSLKTPHIFSNRIGTVVLFIHQLINNHVFNSPVSLREPPSLLGRASAPSGHRMLTSTNPHLSVYYPSILRSL